MASTYSQYKIELIGTGEQAGIWGATTNNNFGSSSPGVYQGFEQAIGGRADITMSSTTVTLTLTNTNAAQNARALYLNLTGTPGGAADLVVPAIQKAYLVKNGTNAVVTIKVTGQTGVPVPVGKTVWVYNNGTDVVTAVDHIPSLTLGAALPVASGGSGATTLTGVVKGNGTSAFTAGQVNLATEVTGDLPFSNLAQGSALSVLGVTGNATADNASIAAASDHQVLRRSGTSVGFGAVNLASANAVTGDLPFSNLAQGSALSVLGVTGNATADNASIAAATDHQVLRRSGTSLGFGAVALNQTNAVTGALPIANGGTGATTNTAARTNLGASTVGSNFFTLTDPSAIRFPRINADNTVSALTDSDFRTAIGAGTGNGSVTSVATGTGLTGGPITSTGTVSVATNGITNTLLRDSAALSVIGRSANSTGDPADIAAGTDHQVLRRSGTSLGFGAIALNQAAAVTGTLASGNGGTGNAFFSVSGPATSTKTYTFPNENMSVGYRNIPAVADKTAAYTLATGDVGKVVGVGSGGSIEIPNATFSAGDAVLVFNNTTGPITITCTITTAYIAGADADVASVTLATRGVCNILFISGTVCVLTGNIA